MIDGHIQLENNVKDYLKTLTLLCVEDNETTQLFYKTMFDGCVKELICAYDGQDGYDKYLNNNVDIVITDYFMPKLDGLMMIEKIRELDQKIPLILVSDIEDVDVITRALRLKVNNFIKKPIIPNEVIQSIEYTSKILIADKFLEEQKNKQLKTLKEKDDYSAYQENLAFSKELNILRNDFYYQMINMECTSLIDFFYKPLDILSGDAYSVRKINNEKTFYLIIDGMSKGISASLSSMLMTSFINHIIDMMLKTSRFDLYELIDAALEYIKPILLDEEAVSADFITIDIRDHKMEYAKFAMPPVLLQTLDGKIIHLKSNDQPISKYINEFNISSYDTSNIAKFLFYSDGAIENTTIHEEKLYAEFIEEDFLDSYTKDDMKEKLLKTLTTQEDDITFIFLNKINLKNSLIQNKVFESSLDTLDIANDWYSDIWNELSDDFKLVYNASIVFTELFMNAFEHGSLGISSNEKQMLLSDDIYFETLENKQKNCNKKITVNIHKVVYRSNTYIFTLISDEGSGFDTNILSKIFRNTEGFNGRGVYVSRKSSEGIYYNDIGNTVMFLHKISSKID